MGEAFLSKHTSAFKHRRDAALPKFCERDLFSFRPDLFYRSYNCEPSMDVAELVGQRVLLIASDAEQVDVQWGGAVIGHVREGEAGMLREAMAMQSECGGLLDAYVDDQMLTGAFTVRLPREFDEEHHD